MLETIRLSNETGRATPLSPRLVYHFSVADPPPCNKTDGGLCALTSAYRWLRSNDTCRLNVVCSRLDGNACGSYGVRVTTGDGKEEKDTTDLCQVGEHLKTDLTGERDSLIVDYWYAAGNKNGSTAACYFWCAASGDELPSTAPVQRVEPQVILPLVSV